MISGFNKLVFVNYPREDDAIILAVMFSDEETRSWSFIQDGEWLTAPLGLEEDNVRAKHICS